MRHADSASSAITGRGGGGCSILEIPYSEANDDEAIVKATYEHIYCTDTSVSAHTHLSAMLDGQPVELGNPA